MKRAWSYRNLEYDDFIEVLDMLEDERRIWIDWEENLYGKRGYSRMIYYTNIAIRLHLTDPKVASPAQMLKLILMTIHE